MTAYPPAIDRLTSRLIGITGSLGFYLTIWPVAITDRALFPWLLAANIGILAGILYWHPYRAWGIAPPTLTAEFLALLAAVAWGWHPVTAAGAGLTHGLALGGGLA